LKPADFKRWRKWMGLSQKEAAEALGLKRRVVQYYEKGERNGETVKIPRSVRLACKALADGTTDYHGPSDLEVKARQAERDKEAKDKKKKKHDRKAQEASKAANEQKAS
jgi:transcriptional regulator with XRE-family HTH domain